MLRSLTVVFSGALFVIAAGALAGRGGAGGGGSSDSLSAEEIDYLQYMREEEKLARDSYLTLDDLWGLQVFANIAVSEQQHTDAVENLLDKYAVPDSVTDETDVGTFVNEELQALFLELMHMGEESALAGLYVGGLIEEKDMRDIQAAIDATEHGDIVRVYENLLCGSRNHLRAFVMNIELAGATYTASVLTQEEVDEIAHSPMEQCSG
jgi:hypothetical protein